MPNGTTTKKAWYKKVFGGKSKTPDPAKVIYETKLAQVTPTIKQAAKLPAYKESMAIQLKEIDKLVKAKQYDDATTQLDALGRQAANALAPTLGTAPNAQALDAIARELANVVGQAKTDKLGLIRPTLEEEEAAVLQEIEKKNDVTAKNYLEALKSRIDDFKKRRTALRDAVNKLLTDAKNLGVTIPKVLQESLDGVSGLITHGQFTQAGAQVTRIQDFVDRSVPISREMQRLHARATVQSEGTQAEIDALRDGVTNALASADLVLAQAGVDTFQDWVRKREGQIEALLDGVDEVKQAVDKHKLKLVPPANVDNDEKTIRGLMEQGKIDDAEKALQTLRAALKPAAELHRLRQLLDRLGEEETKHTRIDATLLATQKKAAEGFLDAGDAKQAQSAIKKILEAIVNYESKLKPEDKAKISRDRIERKLADRLRKAQELAGTSPPQDVKQLLDQMASLKPPHDAKSEGKSAELYTQILVKTNNGKLEQRKGSANGVYVLKTPDKVDIQGTKFKQFFKPVSGESSLPGFPKGGGASREVVGKVMGDKMSAMMGIEMNVPETTVIELPPEALPPDLAKGGSAVGSLQHNVHRKGDAPQLKLSELSPTAKQELYAKIPKKKAQAQQVYDLVFANLDRHADNMFVKGEGDEAELSPIDNGMGLPSKEGLLVRAEAFGLHALKGMPANDDKFDPEVLAGIDKLDEAELAKAAKASFQEMKTRFPNSEATKDELLNDEHLELMKASVRFLKRAAKDLTVNELYNAFLVNLQDVYGMKNSDNDKLSEEQRFDKAIKEAKGRGAALKELNANESAIISAMQTHGWAVPTPPERGKNVTAQTVAKFYPRQVVAIWKANGALKGPMPVKSPVPPAKTLQEYDTHDVDDCAKALGKKRAEIRADDMQYWAAYVALGGDAAVQKLGGALSACSSYGFSIEPRYHLLYRLIKLKEALDGVKV